VFSDYIFVFSSGIFVTAMSFLGGRSVLGSDFLKQIPILYPNFAYLNDAIGRYLLHIIILLANVAID
jgi:hypothetical protein